MAAPTKCEHTEPEVYTDIPCHLPFSFTTFQLQLTRSLQVFIQQICPTSKFYGFRTHMNIIKMPWIQIQNETAVFLLKHESVALRHSIVSLHRFIVFLQHSSTILLTQQFLSFLFKSTCAGAIINRPAWKKQLLLLP